LSHPDLAAHVLGSWTPGAVRPKTGVGAFRDALAQIAQPLQVVGVDGVPAIGVEGVAKLGVVPSAGELPLLGHAPALTPERLGDASFLRAYGVQAAYVAGEMANGIASEALVEAVTRAGYLGVFGAAGLPVERVTAAIDRLSTSLPGKTWGINLIHSPDDQALEAALVELFLARGLRFVSASAYLDLTLPIVRYRATGLRRDSSGAIVVPHRVMAKVSRVEVARKFLEPAPAKLLAELVSRGQLTASEAELAALVPMADDVTAEADSGGHTDNRPLVLLLPALQALRDEVCAQQRYAVRPRIGAAGGLATPASVATAFSMGAAYVVTGSINQATREAGTSDAVRQLLAKAQSTDVAMAPAADMFEMGVKVQVLSRGTLFAVRAQRLYELYRAHPSLEALPATVREELESKFFKSTLDEAWQGCVKFFGQRDPAQLEKAAKDPKHRMALVFRAYLGQASRWANAGVADRQLDYQVWCGPAMGAFNAWTQGSALEAWDSRDAVLIARNLMIGACALTRAAALRTQGVVLPADVEHFAPRTHLELDALLVAPKAIVATATPKPAAAPRAKEPIAIVGLGALFPKASSLQEFWKLLRTGDDAVGDVPSTHWSLADFYDADPKSPDRTYAKRGAFLPTTSFDPTEFGIPPAILEATDTSQLLALVVARMALEDAGYGEDVAWNRARASVLLGVTGTQELVISLGARLGHPHWKKALEDAGVDEETAQDVVARIGASYVGWQENSFPGLLGNVVAGRIANRFDLGGTNCVVDAACASSLGALHLGIAELESGRTDLVLTGGVDTLNDIFMHMCFSKTPALSATGDARPFSDKADGTLLGEGIGMVVLKRLSDAERDGDRIYATIRGIGTSSDGRAKSIYAPLPSGQARALEAAYREAGVHPRDITLLEAHGTGTKAGDAAEFEALQKVYRADSTDVSWCALGSVKSQIGHTKAAAGAAGLIKAALALHHRVVPPTLKIERPNPALNIDSSPFSLPTVARPWMSSTRGPRLAAVSSFGFGGSNFHTVLEEYGSRRGAPSWDGSVELVALSAPDVAGLQAKLAELGKTETLAAFAQASRASFKASDAHRMVVVFGAGSKRDELVSALRARLAKDSTQPFTLPEGAAYGVGAATGSLALLFPGQGAQHVDMLRELACLFPELLESVDADEAIAKAVYPLSTFDAELQQRREAHLTKTDVAQPALGAVERGLLGVLSRFGVEGKLLAGHSYGELVALHAAGVLSAEGLAEASRQRGRLMAGDGSDRGTMLAVLAPLADIEKLIAEEKLGVVLANRNTPSQGVLSGSRDEIARAEAACKARSMRATRLNVGAAFHSPLVADAAQAFAGALAEVSFSAPRVPVIANTTARPYPVDAAEARAQLAMQLAKPVRFDETVEALYASGARTFLEVGPKAALTGMVKATLGQRAFTAIAIDAQGRRGGVFDFAWALAQLAAGGHAVRLTEWSRVAPPPRWKQKPARTPKMVVPLTGANYRSPTKPIPPRAPKPVVPVVPVAAVAAAPVAAPAQLDAVRTLQALQEQTARLHQAFLEGQLVAQQQLSSLMRGEAMPAHLAAPMRALNAMPMQAPMAMPAQNAKPAPVVEAPRAAAVAVNVDATLLATVSELTGYPVETLSLSMDLEADLGIDSIKRVEILSLLSRRIPNAPSVNPEKLSGLKTLKQVRDFIGAALPASPVVAAPASAPAAVAVNVDATLLATVSELTGYPVETLSLSMDLEADLGIDSIKRVEILSLLSRRIPNAPSVNPEKLSGLKTLAQVRDFIGSALPASPVVAAPTPAAVAVNVDATLLATVSELTGYPVDTLSLSMDLEADLGIDSIKRVEILSLLSRRIPNAPSVNPEKLSGLKTLAQVRDFIGAATPAAVTPAATPAPVSVNVDATLLATVSELTGYPVDTLSMSMDLEADLGIDSIKRVEILSLLSRRVPNAPSVNPEKLSGLKTLAQVRDFIGASARPQTPSPAPAALNVDATLLATVSELTGYPAETLSMEMDLEADLGIDSIKRVEILSLLSRRIPNAPSVNPEKLSGLKTLAQVRDFIVGASGKSPEVRAHVPARAAVRSETELARRVVVPVRAAAPSGVGVQLPKAPILVTRESHGLAVAVARAFERAGHSTILHDLGAPLPASIGGVVLLTASTEQQLKLSLQLARDAAASLRATPNAFFATLTRRDGAFGFVAPGEEVLAGGLAGLPKSLSHEWPEVRCRAFDVSSTWTPDEAAAAFVEELTNDGPRELGMGPAGRITLGLATAPVTESKSRLQRGDVVIVTGGARGVTADCARELARTTGVTLVLLGRSPAPAPEADWLAAAHDEAAIKKALLDHAPAGQRPSPKQLGEAYRVVMAGRDIRHTLEGLASMGVRAEYRQVDVRDVDGVTKVLVEARTFGPIRGVVHGAGVLRDKRIEDKRDDDFDQVLDPKLGGLHAVLEATRADELTLIALFASVTGRFGRRGQSDYAVANQALVSIAQAEAVRRPNARVVALDWGPWAGGMVTPALEATFRAEGVSLIPLEDGARAFVAESLASVGSGAEIVLGAGFGDELEAGWTLAHSERIDATWPVLADHKLSGREVLPLAVVIDWFSRAARSAQTGLTWLGLEDVRVLKGVTLQGAPESLSVWLGRPERHGDEVTVGVELRNGRDQVHVRALARYGASVPITSPSLSVAGLAPFSTSLESVYREQLFHGPRLEAITAIEGLGEEGMTLTLRAHPTSEQLVPGPARAWASDPLVIDGLFQALIVWTRARLGAPSLPSRLESLRWFRPLAGDSVRAVVKVRSVEGASVLSDIELIDAEGALVARLTGYGCTVSATLARAFESESSSIRPIPSA
jgi:PfaD family protein